MQKVTSKEQRNEQRATSKKFDLHFIWNLVDCYPILQYNRHCFDNRKRF